MKKGTMLVIGCIAGLIICAIVAADYFSKSPESTPGSGSITSTEPAPGEEANQVSSSGSLSARIAKYLKLLTSTKMQSGKEANQASSSAPIDKTKPQKTIETEPKTTPAPGPALAAAPIPSTADQADNAAGTTSAISTSDALTAERPSITETPGTDPGSEESFFFWSFNSQNRAEGFKKDLEAKTGIALLITHVSEDKYDVGFTYQDEADRIEKIEKIEKAGGIKVQR